MQHHHHWIAFLIFFSFNFSCCFEWANLMRFSLHHYQNLLWKHITIIIIYPTREEMKKLCQKLHRATAIGRFQPTQSPLKRSTILVFAWIAIFFCDFAIFAIFFVCIRKTLREKGDSEERREEESFVVLWWVSQAAINGKLYAIINFDD